MLDCNWNVWSFLRGVGGICGEKEKEIKISLAD